MTQSEDNIVLAAEWVLGTLDADEMALAEAITGNDPEFAALVVEWERRLGELNVLVAPVEPPPDLFEKIRVQLPAVVQEAVVQPDGQIAEAEQPIDLDQPSDFEHPPAEIELQPAEIAVPMFVPDPLPPEVGAGEIPPPAGVLEPPLRPIPMAQNGSNDPRARIVMLRRKVRRWQEVGVTFATLAAMVAGVFVTSLVRPDLMPEKLRPRPKIIEVVKVVEAPPEKLPERPNRFTALLQRDAVPPAFILTVDLADRTMTIRRVAADMPVGKSYELWLVSNQYPAPQSLGVVQAAEFTQTPKLAAFAPETIHDATYAISLEPEGGSPTGTPTGPVLWSGKLIETIAAPAVRPQ